MIMAGKSYSVIRQVISISNFSIVWKLKPLVIFISRQFSVPLKAHLHMRFLSPQLNAIFVAPKLQIQNRTCKPLCDFGAIIAIYRRGMRYNSRNTVTLSSIFTF